MIRSDSTIIGADVATGDLRALRERLGDGARRLSREINDAKARKNAAIRPGMTHARETRR